MTDNNENRLFLGGWICLWRKIANSTLWMGERFTKGQAWIDLLLLAQGVYNSEVRDGQYREFFPGVVYWSLSALGDRWGWNRKTVKTFLDALEQAGMVYLQSTPRKGTVITIANWEQYQEKGRSERTWKNAVFSKNADMENDQNFEKCGHRNFDAQQGIEADFQEGIGQITGQMSGQIVGQIVGHNITKINKEKTKKNNIMSVSQPFSPSASAPLDGGQSEGSGKERIPPAFREQFDSYEAYDRWRNQ